MTESSVEGYGYERRRTEDTSYVASEHGRTTEHMDASCIAQWQWAFDEHEYPQQLGLSSSGNPKPLSGHIDLLFKE
jgi:hypothetical protein